jgi:hypothetical protein
MVNINEIQFDEIDLLTLDMTAVKKDKNAESVIQEKINQMILFETLQYFNMASVGCESKT